MSKTVLITGRNGDILNALPLALHDSQKGERWNIVTSAEFAPLLDGIKYADRTVFKGSSNDLYVAVEFAKSIDANFQFGQVAGDRAVILSEAYAKAGIDINAQFCESFCKEQWRLLGRLSEWKNQYPLVFDNRNESREQDLIFKLPAGKKPWILVSLGGVTSPFPFNLLLIEMLRLKFGRWYEIVDLSKIRAERLYDFIGVFEHSKAKCLVASDSALLQLAYAVPTLPVVALTQDKPSLWHGSPHRPQYIAHVRYGDFPNRSGDILDAISNIGKTGSFFNPNITSNKVVHVWSEYEVNANNSQRCKKAIESFTVWKNVDAEWFVSQSCEVGSWGRDSKVKWMEETYRYPFVKDVIRTAAMRCKSDDLICLTRPDTMLKRNIAWEFHNTPCYSSRIINGATKHQIDLFAFTREWWETHTAEFPDFIMGTDQSWCQALAMLIDAHGGKEVPGLCSREPADPVPYTPSPYRAYNEEELVKFAKKLGHGTAKPPIVEQADCVVINGKAIF